MPRFACMEIIEVDVYIDHGTLMGFAII